nr:hypothetical protein BaRGS_020272 [Batillaria attramentaria]
MDIETQWEHSKKLWHDTCKEVLGKKKIQHKEWIFADTTQKLRKEKKTVLNTSRTRTAKAKAQEEYTAADREVKRSTRKDKRDYIVNLASQAEEAARQGNRKDLYQVTKKLAGKFQQTDKPVKDKNGHPLKPTEEQLKRWAEHFRELLNRAQDQQEENRADEDGHHCQHTSHSRWRAHQGGQEPVAKQILRRKWGWIGHTLR